MKVTTAVKQEFSRIAELIPETGGAVEIRALLNAEIRGLLPKVSVKTLVLLFQLKRHQLSMIELDKRITEKKLNLEESFFVLCHLMSTVQTHKVLCLIYQLEKLILENASEYNQQDIIQIFVEYLDTIVERSVVLLNLLQNREDFVEIIKQVEKEKPELTINLERFKKILKIT